MSTPDALTIPAGRVEARLTDVLDGYRAEWGIVDPLFGETIDLLETLVLAGGKRVRPAMAHWGFVGAGGDPESDEIANLGAALELLQAFALFHDDVMDGSLTRRGEPTAHIASIAAHESGDCPRCCAAPYSRTNRRIQDRSLHDRPTATNGRCTRWANRPRAAARQYRHTPRRVLELVGTNLSSSDVAAIQTVFTETGAVSTIEDQIDVLTTEALDAISRTPLAGDASARLGELATFLATRSS